MAYNYEYPYTDPSRSNFDWILHRILELGKEIENFTALNSVKFHDPIEWYITTQYEKLEIVSHNGVAYLSKQPVPKGITISNPDYWQIIGNFGIDGDRIRKSIAAANEKENILAEFTHNTDDLIWWRGDLYKALTNIAINTPLTVGTNLEIVTIEELLNILSARIGDIEAEKTDVFNVNDLFVSGDIKYSTKDTINRYFDGVKFKDENGVDYNVLVEAVNTRFLVDDLTYVTPEEFGAVGDGVADDSEALQNCLDYASANHKGVKAVNKYKITTIIRVPSNTFINGFQTGTFYDFKPYDNTDFETCSTFYCFEVENVKILDCNFIGQEHTNRYKAKYFWFGERCNHIYFNGCKFNEHDGVSFIYMRNCGHVWVNRCVLKDYTRGGVQFIEACHDCGVLYCEIANGHETNTFNRYPIMLHGYDEDYSGTMGPQGERLFAIGNYIHDDDPWWEGIDAHGGTYIYIAHNTISNIASPIAVFTNVGRGFRADYVFIHDNDCYNSVTEVANPSCNYGNSIGGSHIFVHHNRFRNGGCNYKDANSCGIYFDKGDNIIINDNIIENCYNRGLAFYGEPYTNVLIHNNIIAGVTTHPGTDPIMIDMSHCSTLYISYIYENIFQGGATGGQNMIHVKAPATQSTSTQLVSCKDNKYQGVAPRYGNLANIKPDSASGSTQIAISTVGENGDVVFNNNPTVGQPIGWICTGGSGVHGKTWRSIGNLA